MRKSWNKGLTKEDNDSVRKISDTMKRRGIDNFKKSRTKISYQEFKKNGDLAELTGVVLGDGHIEKFPRCESLMIFSNRKNKGFIKRYSKLIEKIFNKKPSIQEVKQCSCTRIRIYQKFISRRLGIVSGSKTKVNFRIPRWIAKNEDYVLRYLRGLYEAEGSFSVHKPTYTYKLMFSNKNMSLLDIVYRLLKKLGFHPHWGTNQIQLSRKLEIEKFISLIKFRRY